METLIKVYLNNILTRTRMRRYYWYGEKPFDLKSRIFKNENIDFFNDKISYRGRYKPLSQFPIGLWLCPNKQWYKYCDHDEDTKDWIKYKHELYINDNDPGILKLRTDEEVKIFMNKYLIDDEEYLWNKRLVESYNPSEENIRQFELNWSHLKKRVDWFKVFDDYKGYLITKKMDKKYFYNSHNVDSLFVWDSTLIEKSEFNNFIGGDVETMYDEVDERSYTFGNLLYDICKAML